MTVAAEATDVTPAPSSVTYPAGLHAWHALGVLTLVYVFSFVDRQIISLMVGPIRRDLGITDTQISLLTGFAFAVFYAFFGLVLARIADSHSRRGLIAAGFAMWSIFCAGCGLARNFSQLLMMRVGVGVGEASLSPAAYSLITDYFPLKRRPFAQGIYNAGISIGAGLSFILGGLIVGFSATRNSWILPVVGSIRSWQLVFLLAGLPGLILSLLMFTIREPPRQGAGAKRTDVSLREVFAFIKENGRTFACHNLGSAMLFFSAYGTAAWVPTFFIRHFHWTAAQIGTVFGLSAAILGTAGIVFSGWLAGRLAERGYEDACMRVALLAAVLWFPTGIGYLIVPNAAIAAALLGPTIFAANWLFSVAPAALMEITPARMRSQIASLYLFVGNLIGLGLGPTAVALITDYVFKDDTMVGYSLLIVTVAAHLSAAGLFWAGLRPFVRSKEGLEALSAIEIAS